MLCKAAVQQPKAILAIYGSCEMPQPFLFTHILVLKVLRPPRDIVHVQCDMLRLYDHVLWLQGQIKDLGFGAKRYVKPKQS